MVDMVGMKALAPVRRAELIYGAAKAGLSDQLWRAALGRSGGSADDSPGVTPPDEGTRQANLDSLMRLIEQQAQREADRSARAAPPAPAGEAGTPAIAGHGDAGDTVVISATSRSSAAAAPPAPVGLVQGLGANQRYAGVLQTAAERTGIPAPALAAIVDAEAGKGADGSWQIYSRNPRSSAAGLGQFLSRTWEGMAESKGTWLNTLAKANGWLGDNGQVRDDARAQVLALRYNPTASINSIADYAKTNLAALDRNGVSAKGELEATARLAYLGHHLGIGDAMRFMRDGALPEQRARTVLDAQVGGGASAKRIAAAGDAATAHRDWLLGYLDRKIVPTKFLS